MFHDRRVAVATPPQQRNLAVEPHVFHAPAVVLAVDHDGQPLELRLQAGCETGVINDRARPVLLQFPVDLPDEVPAFLSIGQHRLLDEQLLAFRVAISGVVALRAAAVVLEELLVGIVDAAAGIVEADLVVLAGELGEPVRGFDRVELPVDPDLLELVDQDHRRVAVGRDVARGDLDGEPLVRPIPEPGHDLAGLGAVLRHLGAIAGNCCKKIGRHTPHASRWRQHRPADIALTLGEDINEAFAIERQRQCAPQIGIVEGRRLAVDQQIGAGIGRNEIASRLRRLLLHILQQRHRDLVGKGQVELAGNKGEDCGRAVGDDRVFDAVEIRPPRLPISGLRTSLIDWFGLNCGEVVQARSPWGPH